MPPAGVISGVVSLSGTVSQPFSPGSETWIIPGSCGQEREEVVLKVRGAPEMRVEEPGALAEEAVRGTRGIRESP
jgi:hypothetical protein